MCVLPARHFVWLQISQLLSLHVGYGFDRPQDNCPARKECGHGAVAGVCKPDTDRHAALTEQVGKELHFTSLRYHRLDDLKKSVGIDRASCARIAGTEGNNKRVWVSCV